MPKTKKCPYCRSDIDKKAKICPHCQKKQFGLGSLFSALIVIISLSIFIPFVTKNCSGNNDEEPERSVEVVTTESREKEESTTKNAKVKQEKKAEPETEATTEQETKIEPETEVETAASPIEMNSLQMLFVSLTTETNRDQIDSYITNNGLLKYAFSHDCGYYIGYDSDSIRSRGRDRIGEAVDISFVTSGSLDKLGTVMSAEYAIHTGLTTSSVLKFENDLFYYKGETYSNGEEAMQKFLSDNVSE